LTDPDTPPIPEAGTSPPARKGPTAAQFLLVFACFGVYPSDLAFTLALWIVLLIVLLVVVLLAITLDRHGL
jgi:hypothetical protein